MKVSKAFADVEVFEQTLSFEETRNLKIVRGSEHC